MTVPSTNYKAGPFSCDGVQTEFPFEFPALDKSHIAVWKDGAPVVVGYTITLAGNGGGTVTFETAPAKGSRVAIIRDVPLTQTTDLQNNTAFLPEVLEAEYDKGAMIDQMLAEAVSRCLKVSPTDEALDISEFVKRIAEAVSLAQKYAEDARKAAESVGGVQTLDSKLQAFLALSGGTLTTPPNAPTGVYVPVMVDGTVKLYPVSSMPTSAYYS